MQEKFAETFPETPVPHRNAFRRLIEKFCETGSVLDAERSGRTSRLNVEKLLDISDSMLRVHACMDAGGNHFQHLLEVRNDFPNTVYKTESCKEFEWKVAL